MLKYNCEKAMRITIPAVRAAVSSTLRSKHGMSETDIAKRLGIAQAAVSKYISGRYSKDVGRLVRLILVGNMENRAVRAVLSGKENRSIGQYVERLASDRRLVRAALEA